MTPRTRIVIGAGLLAFVVWVVFSFPRPEPAPAVTIGSVSYTNGAISLYVTNSGGSAVFLSCGQADWIVKPEANGQSVLLMWPQVDGRSTRQMFARIRTT